MSSCTELSLLHRKNTVLSCTMRGHEDSAFILKNVPSFSGPVEVTMVVLGACYGFQHFALPPAVFFPLDSVSTAPPALKLGPRGALLCTNSPQVRVLDEDVRKRPIFYSRRYIRCWSGSQFQVSTRHQEDQGPLCCSRFQKNSTPLSVWSSLSLVIARFLLFSPVLLAVLPLLLLVDGPWGRRGRQMRSC